MNILFIDNLNVKLSLNKSKKYSILYNKFGFYSTKNCNKKISYLNINDSKLEDKFYVTLLKGYLKNKFKKDKVYVVLSKDIQEKKYIKDIIKSCLSSPVFVTSQNNLYDNDKIYIEDYISKNKIKLSDVRVLLVIDELGNIEKRKLEELIKKYRIVDIYSTYISRKCVDYINEINQKYGAVIDILDKMPKDSYNIVLIFSNKQKINKIKGSFILDYNDSDLDIKSNTYLLYKKNAKYFNDISCNLNMDMSRYEKTKLGKLYIHASRLILDK